MEHVVDIQVRGGEIKCIDGVVSMRRCVVDFEVYVLGHKDIDVDVFLGRVFPDYDKNKMGHRIVECFFTQHLTDVRENE